MVGDGEGGRGVVSEVSVMSAEARCEGGSDGRGGLVEDGVGARVG